MATVNSTDRTVGSVMLADGIRVPLPVLRFCWQLEDRGCRIRVEGDELSVGPRKPLNDSDRTALRQWRDAIRAVVEYCERREARQ